MIERFVELAQKHAPELDARLERGTLSVLHRDCLEGRAPFCPKLDPVWSADFTITLLEYLKGLEKSLIEKVCALDANDPANKKLVSILDRVRVYTVAFAWRDLTPEALMQACIDVWEAME